MATPTAPSAATLRLECTLAAPIENVFSAWTEAEKLKSWFAPSDEYQVVATALDPRVGGEYRVEMRHASGRISVATGIYREVTRPSKLVFTWAWEDKPAEETLVTVELEAEGRGTRLVLTHERFLTAKDRDDHEQGWTGCLARLERFLTN